MSKIGIMGGTFNPVHKGHIKLASSALRELKLDKIWFMPSKNPPHKVNSDIASEEHRVAMLRIAIGSYKEFELSLVELEREGTTYTVDTLEELKKRYKDDEFYFIIGADSLVNIEKWHMPEKLFKLTTFVVASRDDVDKSGLEAHIAYLRDKYEEVDIVILNMDRIDVSSTEIRRNCAKASYFKASDADKMHMDAKGYEYILSNKVYI